MQQQQQQQPQPPIHSNILEQIRALAPQASPFRPGGCVVHDGALRSVEAASYYLTLLLAGPGAATTISAPATAGSNSHHI